MNYSNQDKYQLAQIWGNYVSAQHTLLGAWTTTHAFLFVSLVMLYIDFHEKIVQSNVVSPFIFILTTILSFIGIYLCFQMRLAWDRSRALISLLECNIRDIENSANNTGNKFFSIWHSAQEMPSQAVNFSNSSQEWKSNYALKMLRKPWGIRASSLPWIFGLFYLCILIALVFNIFFR